MEIRKRMEEWKKEQEKAEKELKGRLTNMEKARQRALDSLKEV